MDPVGKTGSCRVDTKSGHQGTSGPTIPIHQPTLLYGLVTVGIPSIKYGLVAPSINQINQSINESVSQSIKQIWGWFLHQLDVGPCLGQNQGPGAGIAEFTYERFLGLSEKMGNTAKNDMYMKKI